MQLSVNHTGAAQPWKCPLEWEGSANHPWTSPSPWGHFWQPQNCLMGTGYTQYTRINTAPSRLITRWCKGKGCQWNYGVSAAPTPTLLCSPWTPCYKHEPANRSSFQEGPKCCWAWHGMVQEDAHLSWFRLRVRSEGQQLHLTMAKCRSSACLIPQTLKPWARTLETGPKIHIFLFSHLYDHYRYWQHSKLQPLPSHHFGMNKPLMPLS